MRIVRIYRFSVTDRISKRVVPSQNFMPATRSCKITNSKHLHDWIPFKSVKCQMRPVETLKRELYALQTRKNWKLTSNSMSASIHATRSMCEGKRWTARLIKFSFIQTTDGATNWKCCGLSDLVTSNCCGGKPNRVAESKIHSTVNNLTPERAMWSLNLKYRSYRVRYRTGLNTTETMPKRDKSYWGACMF